MLLGPSGCGRSTVLRMVAGLEDPTSGAVLLNGEFANDLPPRDRSVAMVFQDFALYPHLSVGDNIAFPLRLLEAAVHVHLDQHVALNLGEQTLHLPWDDTRARAVGHYHGERIVVGLRAEALTPTAPNALGPVLHGQLRHLEHHGHESLAFLDVGATAIVVDEAVASADGGVVGQRGRRQVGRVLRRITGRAGTADEGQRAAASRSPASVFRDPGRHHNRPAELAVRLAPYPAVAPGQRLALQVQMDALHFFDEHGDRIDVGWR